LTEIIGVRFKNAGKVYYFDPSGMKFTVGTEVIVETARGSELGECVNENMLVEDDKVVQPLKKVLRPATEEDRLLSEKNIEKSREAMAVCQKKADEYGLDMKIVDVEYTFDGSKILFYFTAEGRVDFRDLVKELAGIFRVRIELRQIGVRDEAKLVGGIGICGRPFCCSSFLESFHPVSIKMAKEQNLSLNPTKISGTCGRLMCCLKYEQDAYTYLLNGTPRVGSLVMTPDGEGTVTEVQLLRQQLKVLHTSSNETTAKYYPVDQVSVIRSGKPKPKKPDPEE